MVRIPITAVACALFMSLALFPSSSESAAPGFITTVTPLPAGSAAWSLVAGPDGNLWFSGVDEARGVANYFGRVQPNGTVTYFPLPYFTIHGKLREPTFSMALANAPRTASGPSAPQLVFSWSAYDAATQTPNEAGLGLIDLETSPRITEYAALNPGDPLYNPRFTFPIWSTDIASASSPAPAVWVYASKRMAQSLLVGFPFPFSLQEPTVLQVTPESALFNTMETGADGNLWFLQGAYIDRFGAGGITQFEVWPGPVSLAASPSELWVSGEYNPSIMSRVGYSGKVDAGFAASPLGFETLSIAAGSDAAWSISGNAGLTTLYFMRLDSTGQWSSYPFANPFGTARPMVTGLAVASNNTVWVALDSPGYDGPSALVSLDTNRVLATRPARLSLIQGQSAKVSLMESNGVGQVAGISVATGCPLIAVPVRSTNSFIVTARGAEGQFPCGVTVTNSDGISAWLPVTLPHMLAPGVLRQ